MYAYELMYIVDATLDSEAIEAVQNRVASVITEQGGIIDKVDVWGKRRLAYEINGHREGFYVLVYFKAASTREIERLLRLNDNIIRFLVVRQEEEHAQAAETAAQAAGEADAAEAAEAEANAEPETSEEPVSQE